MKMIMPMIILSRQSSQIQIKGRFWNTVMPMPMVMAVPVVVVVFRAHFKACYPDAMLLALLACKDKTEEAPPTLEEAAMVALVEFETKDYDAALSVILEWTKNNIDVDAVSLPKPELARLSAESAAMTFSENTDADQIFGAALAGSTQGSLMDYAETVPEEDQVWCSPEGYTSWTRTLTEGTAEGFLAGESLRTDNDIVKKSLIYDIPYPTQKDYQWVEIDGQEAILYRAWLYEEGWDGDSVGAIAGFQVELWAEGGEGIVWFMAAWNQIVTPVGDEDFLRNELVKSLWGVQEGSEAYVLGE